MPSSKAMRVDLAGGEKERKEKKKIFIFLSQVEKQCAWTWKSHASRVAGAKAMRVDLAGRQPKREKFLFFFLSQVEKQCAWTLNLYVTRHRRY